ncbi:halocyanin domain protein [Halorhabdus utahensis DSM 12940]|uniref:Halocyanin domain protein n=1 Tax=Halorhabdus utahensis (strain DSM 12940 / JCM 11049 / AX-2) TaxID=519442 RepID=C7NSU6_HALUD|nr:halocyanin domain-containing protein [Halorhabdus utahensis]ACV10757.1 halocyanin domain protein [Halorhabdus utahensis DSM 12940]
MTDDSVEFSRRALLRASGAAAGGTAAIGGVGSAAAQEGGSGQIDYSGWFSGVSNFSSTVDRRGEDEVTVEVGVEANQGYFGFGPAAVWVDPDTTVTWEWTGRGNAHNVVAEDDSFTSGSAVAEAGTTYERTFSEARIHKYYCEPHELNGMKGAIVVGDDVPTVEVEGPSGPVVPESAKLFGVTSGFAMTAVLGLAYFFMKYGGDYGDVE